jgi:hypothetical protein
LEIILTNQLGEAIVLQFAAAQLALKNPMRASRGKHHKIAA